MMSLALIPYGHLRVNSLALGLIPYKWKLSTHSIAQKYFLVQLIESICNRFPNQVFLSYNGGKDCSVLLGMLEQFPTRVPVVYLKEPEAFPELQDFVEYQLSKTTLPVLRKGITSEMI